MSHCVSKQLKLQNHTCINLIFISGVGLDMSSDLLFISVSNGYVYRSSLSKKSISEPILTPETISYKPQDLSVDWLNRHLYVLGEVYYTKKGWSNTTSYWKILRSDFDGKNQIVALSGFNSRPIHFEVDAYNGSVYFLHYYQSILNVSWVQFTLRFRNNYLYQGHTNISCMLGSKPNL